MKVCLAQINTTPGDFDGNLARILKGMKVADAAGADLLVFPELTIPGYLTQDLIYNQAYVARNLEVLDEIVAASADLRPELHLALGYIDKNKNDKNKNDKNKNDKNKNDKNKNESKGKPWTNMAAVIAGGKLLATYQKQLLPFYDVFDELRYFEPGSGTTILEVAGRRVGLAICEDLWNDKGEDNYSYRKNPLAQYVDAGVDLILSLNSSPWVHGKGDTRLDHLLPPSKGGPTIVYVNQVGGQDELVFDGQSFVVRDGKVIHQSTALFEDSFEVVDLDQATDAGAPPSFKRVSLENLLVLGLKDYVEKSGFSELVLASSGGVDSALVCKLACDAVGPENVHAIRMPSIHSSDHSRTDARALHENLGCRDYEVPIEHLPLVALLGEAFKARQGKGRQGSYDPVADENIQARLRDLYVMHFSNAYGAMPLSTGNKTESGCGYYTHFDMNFSYAPIKDLYKFQVVALARADERVPPHIWQKPPSAELAKGQEDEKSLLPYALLDPIVMGYIEQYVTSFDGFGAWVERALAAGEAISGDPARLLAWLAEADAPGQYQRIVSLIGRMEYKRRQTCPGTKVSAVAFGIGRRIPIVEKWS